MAQYKHLPIYRLTYEILQKIIVATKTFPREFRFTLAHKMQDEVVEMVVLIYRANSSQDKAPLIERFLEHLQVLELLTRLSHDMRLMPTKSYAAIVEMTESLGRQAHGWKRTCKASK